MTARTVTNPEPLTLYTTPDLERLYQRAALSAELSAGRLPRLLVDRAIAKVLPRGSVFSVDPFAPGIVRIRECAYRPYFEKDLFAIDSLVVDTERTSDDWRTPQPPSRVAVLARLLSCEGIPYLFGGSAPEGSAAQAAAIIDRGWLEAADLSIPELRQVLLSSGIDCSGLFNLATQYAFFGDSKDVYRAWARSLVRFDAGSAERPEELAAALEPCDIILFRGHMTIALGDGRVIQAVGDGRNAQTFADETGYTGPPWTKYNRVAIDEPAPILRALLHRQGRRYSSDWRLDDQHFMILRRPAPVGRA